MASRLLLAAAAAGAICGRAAGQAQLDPAAAAAARPVCANYTQAARRTVAVGGQGTCALIDGGRPVCWGPTRFLVDVPQMVHVSGASSVAITKDSTVAVAVAGSSLVRWGGGNGAGAGTSWPSVDTLRAEPLVASGVAYAAAGPVLYFGYSPCTPAVVTAWVTPGGAVRVNATSLAIKCPTPPISLSTTAPFFFASDVPGPGTPLLAVNYANPNIGLSLSVVPPAYAAGQAAVVVASKFACALSTAGGVGCWSLWEACSNVTLAPVNGSAVVTPPSVAANQVALTAGRVHACALSANGSVTCWGAGPQAFVPPWAAAGQVALSAAPDYTCAVSRGGRVSCWGAAAFDWDAGSLAYTSVLSPPASLPADIVDVATGAGEACALSARGRLYCWGRADRGTPDDGVSGAPDVAQGRIDLPCVPPEFAAYAPGGGGSSGGSPSPAPLPCGDAQLRPLPGYDLVGVPLARLAVAAEADCRTACCAAPACAGYAFAAGLLGPSAAAAPCTLLSNATQLVPSTIMSAGVKAGTPAAAAAAA